MSALVPCPECDGAGELTRCVNDGTHGCSHTNDSTYKCWDCQGEGAVRADQVDAEGELIHDDCRCDGERGTVCNNPECVMDREREMRWMEQQYRAGKLTPKPVEDWKYADSLMNAGRGHLLTDEQRAAWDSAVPF